MQIEGVGSVPLIRVKIKVVRKGDVHEVEGAGWVYADGFSAVLPANVLNQISVGDHVELVCVPHVTGKCSHIVFWVKWWRDVRGFGEALYSLGFSEGQLWEDLTSIRI